jgi:hypothetical protein
MASSTMARVELRILEISGKMQVQHQETADMLAAISTRLNSQHFAGQSNKIDNYPLFPISSVARLRDNQVTHATSHGQSTASYNSDTVCIKAKVRPHASCKKWCSCSCHAQQSIKFPRIVRNFVGSLFVGYSGLPILTPSCDEKSCLKRSSPSITVSYYFPTWFLSRVLNITATFNTFRGPQLDLNMPRMVGWVHPLWRHAHRNDVNSIQALFSQELASPFDVNAYGQSALHVGFCSLRTSAIDRSC